LRPLGSLIMIRNRFGWAALVGAALVMFSPAAKAYVISFDFTSADYTVVGTIDIAAHNVSPVNITAINALVNGTDATTIVPNPTVTDPLIIGTPVVSADGLWLYDNVGYSGNPHLDNAGLLFTAGGYEYNIFETDGSPIVPGSRPESVTDDYTIWRSVIGGTYDGTAEPGTLIATDNSNGNGTSSAVPELSTWAMMLIGFASIGFVAYRRTKKGSTAITAA
jgi:hypothetical protein